MSSTFLGWAPAIVAIATVGYCASTVILLFFIRTELRAMRNQIEVSAAFGEGQNWSALKARMLDRPDLARRFYKSFEQMPDEQIQLYLVADLFLTHYATTLHLQEVFPADERRSIANWIADLMRNAPPVLEWIGRTPAGNWPQELHAIAEQVRKELKPEQGQSLPETPVSR